MNLHLLFVEASFVSEKLYARSDAFVITILVKNSLNAKERELAEDFEKG